MDYPLLNYSEILNLKKFICLGVRSLKVCIKCQIFRLSYLLIRRRAWFCVRTFLATELLIYIPDFTQIACLVLMAFTFTFTSKFSNSLTTVVSTFLFGFCLFFSSSRIFSTMEVKRRGWVTSRTTAAKTT